MSTLRTVSRALPRASRLVSIDGRSLQLAAVAPRRVERTRPVRRVEAHRHLPFVAFPTAETESGVPRMLPAYALAPRPLFLYGTLRAIPLLAWALTGDATKTELVRSITRDAYVTGYARYTVLGKDYPAVIKHNSNDPARLDGLLLTPQNYSQRAKLDDFEGETYQMESVIVVVTDDRGREELMDADMYLWGGNLEDVSEESWDLETFERERLDDWLELFGGMELVGQDSNAE